MVKRKTKRQKRNKKIVIAVVLILAVLLGIISIVFVAYPDTYAFGEEGSFFGLFGTDSYGLPFTVNTNPISNFKRGVSGQGRIFDKDLYLAIDKMPDDKISITCTGRVKVDEMSDIDIGNRLPKAIGRYWWTVKYRESSASKWRYGIGGDYVGPKGNPESGYAGWIDASIPDVRNGFSNVEGHGVKQFPGISYNMGAWHFINRPVPQYFDTSQLKFDYSVPENFGGGAIRIELHCQIYWTEGFAYSVMNVNEHICLVEEAKVFHSGTPPPDEVPPPDEMPSSTLVIITTPHAKVNLVGYEMKDSGASGKVTYTGLAKGRYLISAQKAGYYHRSRQINFPDEQIVELPLTYSRPDIETSNDLIVKTNPTNCEVMVAGVGSKNSGNEGIARWNNLPDGKYTITVRKSGYRSGRGYVTLPAVLQYNEIFFTISKLPDKPPPPEPPERPDYNQRPLVRTISGLHSGDVGVEYEFSAMACDPDGDEFMHKFFWGDGTSTGWLAEGRAKHKYNAEGTYQITVQVFDGELYGNSGLHQFVAGTATGDGVELTVPLIEASNAQSGMQVRVTIRVQTEAEPNDFDIKAYVKSPSGAYLVNTWSLSKTKDNELYTATLTYNCGEEGIVTIGAQTVSKVDAYRSSVVTEKAVYSTVGGIAESAPPQPTGDELPEYEAPEIPGFETIIFIIAAFVTCVILYKRRR